MLREARLTEANGRGDEWNPAATVRGPGRAASIDDHRQLWWCERRRSSASSRNNPTKLDSFLKADSPELAAKRAVGFDGIADIEQSHQIGDRKAVLQLLAPAPRACRCEDNRLTHGSWNLCLARRPHYRRSIDSRVGSLPTSLQTDCR